MGGSKPLGMVYDDMTMLSVNTPSTEHVVCRSCKDQPRIALNDVDVDPRLVLYVCKVKVPSTNIYKASDVWCCICVQKAWYTVNRRVDQRN